jgi:DNA repair exonuclease SbcCD ATPase subunit
MMTDNELDYNYCLTNISMPGLVKWGFTGDHPKTRAEDLFTTGVPTPFEIEFVVELPKGFGRDFEKKIHEHLSHCRVNQSREFFKISAEEVKNIVENEFGYKTFHISDLPPPVSKSQKNIKKIIELYEELKEKYEATKEYANEFLSKLENHGTELRSKEKENNVVEVTIYKYDNIKKYTFNCLDSGSDTSKHCGHIINDCNQIKRHLNDYEKCMKLLEDNFEEISQQKTFYHDTKDFLEKMNKTQEDVKSLLTKYKWSF